MFLTKKAISRRAMLKSAQGALALPLLDAMIPAATAWAKTPARPVRRLGFVFIPMGCDQDRWTPPGQGKLDESVPYFEKAIDQTTDEVIPFNVAEIYFNQGNAAKAIEYYKKAAERKLDWPEPHLKLGFAYLNTGDMAAARASFEKVVEIAPDSPQAAAAKQTLASLPK